MRISLVTFSMVVSLFSFAADKMNVEGTLFKKNGKWHLFVESENSAIRKGVIELVDTPGDATKYLIEKAVVSVTGNRKACDSKQICLAVLSIRPTTLDPLKRRQ